MDEKDADAGQRMGRLGSEQEPGPEQTPDWEMVEPKPDSGSGANPESGISRDAQIVRTGTVGIVTNALLAAFKAAVGLLSNSIAIVLDAVNNLSDAASSIITIVGTKLAAKDPDREHPYGYGRIEYLTTIIIAVIVLWAGITSMKESIDRIIEPQLADYSAVTLVIVAVAVIAKIVLGRYTKRVGERVNSGSLVASGTDAMMDSIISAATLVAAFIYIFTGVALEAWLGLIISVFIIKAGIDMLREVISRIIGERVNADITVKVKDVVRSVEGVRGAYDLILEDYGPDTLWGSVHVEVDDTMTAAQIDALTREIQRKTFIECNVLLHTVGIYASNTHASLFTQQIRRELEEIAEANPYILGVHGLYVDELDGFARFDVVVSFDASDRHAVVEDVKAQMHAKHPELTFTAAMDADISD
jgi:cation diffusion facilitator family transporter